MGVLEAEGRGNGKSYMCNLYEEVYKRKRGHINRNDRGGGSNLNYKKTILLPVVVRERKWESCVSL